ncbi:MAG: cysteine--tRNA ligase [Acidaminococcaceae bacterium]|nr:cysteine--tRNA ligase [Acidaminococcaceae bacterium]
MAIKVYNTLTKKKEEFVPINPSEARIYVCGVTPYNHPHVGNARPFVTWDVIRRFLEHEGYDVTHVQNFTDVDDKIINTANKEGVQWFDICNRYIDSYYEVMDKLNVRRAHVYPRVSEHIEDIIGTVAKLIENKHAYVVDGDVYYSVESFARYGELSGRNLEDMQAGARVDVDERKKHPMDFALWKAAKPDEPSWDSPWGKGRPGWHIECSTMSMKYLGEQFDFHGGGSDLIFPHHENEIAQSEGCTLKHPFVRYWLHNGFITVNEEKMSKSLGNFFMVIDILKNFDPETLRFFIVETHYRSPLDFSDARLNEAKKSLSRLRNAKEVLGALVLKMSSGPTQRSLALRKEVAELREKFMEAMRDDFNTALAISYMFELAKKVNAYKAEIGEGKPDGKLVDQMQKVFAEMCSIIGILENKEGVADKTAAPKESDPEAAEIEAAIAKRAEAKKNKDYKLADQIRAELAAKGIILQDTPQGVKWTRE